MRTLSNSILRSVCSLVIGVLLVVWPEAAMIYLVITIGVLFLIPGLISLWGYFAHRTGEARQMFPVVALGSALFGLWLMIMPKFFVSILMYILGAFLVLAGIQLLSGLVSARRGFRESLRDSLLFLGRYCWPVSWCCSILLRRLPFHSSFWV